MSYKTSLEGTRGSYKAAKRPVVNATENAVYFSAPFVDMNEARIDAASRIASKPKPNFRHDSIAYGPEPLPQHGGGLALAEPFSSMAIGVSNVKQEFSKAASVSKELPLAEPFKSISEYSKTFFSPKSDVAASQFLAEEPTPGSMENAIDFLIGDERRSLNNLFGPLLGGGKKK